MWLKMLSEDLHCVLCWAIGSQGDLRSSLAGVDMHVCLLRSTGLGINVHLQLLKPECFCNHPSMPRQCVRVRVRVCSFCRCID